MSRTKNDKVAITIRINKTSAENFKTWAQNNNISQAKFFETLLEQYSVSSEKHDDKSNSLTTSKDDIVEESNVLDGIIKDIDPIYMQRIKEKIKETITEDSYRVWFKSLLPVSIDEAERCIIFAAENDFAEEVIRNRYIGVMEECIEAVFGVRYKVFIGSR